MTFSDFDIATRTRDVILGLVEQQVERTRPRIQYAVVNTIDRAALKCTVTVVGDTVPGTVKMGTIQPAAVGNVVRIDGPVGDRFIAEVLGGNAYVGAVSAVSTGDTTVTGIFRSKYSTTSPPGGSRFWSGLELAHPALTPFIDFHNSTDPEESTNYTWRLIQESATNFALLVNGGTGFGSGFRFFSDGEFDCNHIGVGGDNTVNAGVMTYDWFRAKGNNGTFFQDWGGGWFMSDTTWIRAYQDKSIYTAATVGAGVARMGALTYADHANFCHSNFVGSAQRYGFLQRWDGWIWISGGPRTTFQTDDAERMFIDSNAIHIKDRVELADSSIWSRVWNDDWHVWGWWSGNDGLRITEYGGLYFRVRDTDPALEILAIGVTRARRFDQIGAYDTSALMTKSEGGGSGTKVGFWSAGQNAAHILKCWGSTIEVRSWDDGGWGTLNGVLGNQSSIKGKKNVVTATTKLSKADRKAKVKRTRAVHYNRKDPEKGWCANCVGTGRFKKRLEPDAPETEVTCPYCNGDPMSLPAPAYHVKQEESGWFGFISEELVQEFPEAVFWRQPEDGGAPEPSSVDTLALIAVLWDEVKDLEDRLVTLESKGK